MGLDKKVESSPIFSKANTTDLEAWELAHSHANEPQASPLPSALFLQATCTLAEIPTGAQANTSMPGSNGNPHVPLCFQQNEAGKTTPGQRQR